VLGSLWDGLMYNDNSTSRSGGVLPQAEFIPKLSKSLQESPSEILADFEEIRKYSKWITDPFTGVKTQLIYNSHGAVGHQILGHWECLEPR